MFVQQGDSDEERADFTLVPLLDEDWDVRPLCFLFRLTAELRLRLSLLRCCCALCPVSLASSQDLNDAC